MATIFKFKRGTLAQLDAAAAANQLRQGEPYVITDQNNRFALGLSANTYERYAKVSELGGGGSSDKGAGIATIDFGTSPGSNEASVVIIGQTLLADDMAVNVEVAYATNGSHTPNDHRYAALFIRLVTGPIVPGVGFTIYATSTEKMVGTFTVKYSWI